MSATGPPEDDPAAGSDVRPADEPPELADVVEELQELEGVVESAEAKRRIRATTRMALEVGRPDVFGRVIRGYDRADVAEAFVGSLLFGIPMFVEGGTNEVGSFVATRPVYLVATHALALGVAVGIIYVADIQDVRVHRPLFGLVPRRLVGVLAVSFGTSAAMMTVWGRVSWTDPWLAVCTASVAFVPMVIGAALGDILPGS